MKTRMVWGLVLLCWGSVLWAESTPVPEPASPRPQLTLAPMLKVTWQRGPNLPQGLQDGAVGFVGNNLVLACGFCSGRQGPQKQDRYPRGFLNQVWGLDVTALEKGWQRLPDYPGTPRQGLGAITVSNGFYCWGGFNYTAPFSYAQGYRLRQVGGKFIWEALPDFPWPICGAGLTSLGTRIYSFGGADYDENRFYTETDRHGTNGRQGARLVSLDTLDTVAGWRTLTDCPGTPRWVQATSAVGGRVYVIGGATGDLTRDGKPYGYCTVADNWAYDPTTRRWTRLRDLPIGSGNFPAGQIAYAARYILLIGGYQYAHVCDADGTIRPTYGQAGRYQGKGEYFNDVFVYDTQTDRFGRADALPINNNAPMAVVRGDTIYLLGGETGGGWIEGEYYGHHPDLLLMGRIEPLK